MQIYAKQQLKYFFKISIFSLILSAFFSIIAHSFVKSELNLIEIFLSTIKIFFGILPVVFLKQRNFLFKDGPLKSSCLILYYLLLVPLINYSIGNTEADHELKYFFYFLSFINIILLVISHILLLKYIFRDFFKTKRKITSKDIIVVITTYITFAISFGLLYTLISSYSTDIAFNNIPKTLGEFEFYFRHIYFSFITITTIGYGDIYPLTTLGRFLVIIEVITGIILTNVILGLIIGSGILTTKDK